MDKKYLLTALYRLIVCLVLSTFLCKELNAQLCTGSLGDPVVNITFGSGPNPGSSLNAATTNYTYVSSDCPNDGMYTIINKTSACFGNTWHSVNQDHTGDSSGYFMLVNASFTPSDFYLQKVDGLCGNTTYEFAAWIMNMCLTDDRIKPNITFRIEKIDGTVLQSFSTGDISITHSAQWKQYGFFFKTPVNTSSVVIRMTNNAPGGIGNDLALDDITFRPCGASISASVNGTGNTTLDICDGATSDINLTASVSAGYNAPVFQWQLSTDNGNSWKDIPAANQLSYIRKATSKGSYIYRLTVAETGNIGITGCRVASNPVSINIRSNPELQLTSDSVVCEGANLSLKASIKFFSPGPWDTVWSVPNAAMNISFYSSQIDSTSLYSASITKIIKTTGSDAGTYSLSIANKYGCKAFAATAVSIRLKPTANFTLSSLSCEKRTTAFSDLSSGHAPLNSWYWDFGDSSTGNEPNPNHIFNGSKIYSVREVVKDANGCISDTAIYGIQVNALPDVDFVLPKICLADPFASFINLSTISDDTENSFIYSWNFDDAISGNLNTSVDKDPKHKYSATGNYNVHLAVTSKDGCKNDSTKLFTVNGVKPKALFNIDNSGVLCSKDSIGISNASTVDFGSIVKVEIYWDYGNDPLNKLTDTLPFNNKVYNNNYFSQTNQSSKDFIIHYIAYSGISCMNQISKTVTIQRSPVVQFGPVPSVCEEVAPFLITEAIETTGTSGAPSFTGDGMNKNGLFNPSAASKGLHSIHYTYTTNAGCSASTEQNILVYPKPAVNAGPDRVAIKGTYITLHASASGNNLTYSWIPAASIDNPAILDPGVSPTSDITYTLTATSSDGCSNQDNVFITVTNRLYIPTAFTPNGDGLNDVWKLPSLESYPNAQAWIYDRWGNLIFHSSGATVSWDGSFNGKPQPAGSYIYLIDLKNSTPILKGTITLIR